MRVARSLGRALAPSIALLAALVLGAGGALAADPAPTPAAATFTIGGQVRVADTTTGVPDAQVYVCDPEVIGPCLAPGDVTNGTTWTDSSGDFTFSGLPPGSYQLVVVPRGDNPRQVLPGWYAYDHPNHYTAYKPQATVIILSSGDATGIWVGLPVGHRIAGRLTMAGEAQGIPGATIEVNDCTAGVEFCQSLSGTVQTSWSGLTDAAGYWMTGLLPDGSYQVKVTARDAEGTVLTQGWYTSTPPSHVTTEASAETRITLAGADVRGVDMALPVLCPTCVPPVDSAGSAWGAGVRDLPEGRAHVAFAVGSVSTGTGAHTVAGVVTWRLDGWRFAGLLDRFWVTDGVGTATGSGILLVRDGSAGSRGWIPVTVGPARVRITFTGATSPRRGPTDRGSVGISFFGDLAPGMALPSPMQRGPLDAGMVTVR